MGTSVDAARLIGDSLPNRYVFVPEVLNAKKLNDSSSLLLGEFPDTHHAMEAVSKKHRPAGSLDTKLCSGSTSASRFTAARLEGPSEAPEKAPESLGVLPGSPRLDSRMAHARGSGKRLRYGSPEKIHSIVRPVNNIDSCPVKSASPELH